MLGRVMRSGRMRQPLKTQRLRRARAQRRAGRRGARLRRAARAHDQQAPPLRRLLLHQDQQRLPRGAPALSSPGRRATPAPNRMQSRMYAGTRKAAGAGDQGRCRLVLTVRAPVQLTPTPRKPLSRRARATPCATVGPPAPLHSSIGFMDRVRARARLQDAVGEARPDGHVLQQALEVVQHHHGHWRLRAPPARRQH